MNCKSEDSNIFEEHREVDQVIKIKKPKTNAQKCKEYRERQKIRQKIELRKKNAQKCKEYRERLKSSNSSSTKTAAEYKREYRRRIKLKHIIKLSASIQKDHSENIMSAIESTSSEDTKDELLSDRNVMLRTLLLKSKEEMKYKCLPKPVDEYIDKVAYYTGVSKTTIKEVVTTNLKEINYVDKYFSLSDRTNIFEYVAAMYNKRQIPTHENIFTWYSKINTAITFPQFQYMMSCLGFEYYKQEIGTEILIENPSLTFDRYLFLKQINSYRSKCAPIYYIDEVYLDVKFTFSKPWTKNIDISSQDGYVFFHAVSKQGFVNGLFCSPTTKTDFVKWITHILMPMLPGPSVFVLDNNDLHGSLMNNITKYHSKNDMLKYLREKNIPCNENLQKAELYELIKKCSVNHAYYDIDEILKAHGHQVLRLPANFFDLSLTHFLWKYILEFEKRNLLNIDLSQIKTVLLEKLTSLSQPIWNILHEELLKTEKVMLDIDSKARNDLATNFKIN